MKHRDFDVNLVPTALMVCMQMDIMHSPLPKIIVIKFVQVLFPSIIFTMKASFVQMNLIFILIYFPFKNSIVDVDECTLGLSNCGLNAFCENSIGSFSCHCNKGINIEFTHRDYIDHSIRFHVYEKSAT